MAEILRPIAPPREIEGVYTDDQHARILDVIKGNGPWPTVAANHFDTIEELVATSSGSVPDGLTLDDIAAANFRGFFGKDSVLFFDELHDCFYNPKFMQLAKDYWGARYARPTLMLFNLCGPHQSGLSPHLDAVTFRGIRIENAPVWLQ